VTSRRTGQVSEDDHTNNVKSNLKYQTLSGDGNTNKTAFTGNTNLTFMHEDSKKINKTNIDSGEVKIEKFKTLKKTNKAYSSTSASTVSSNSNNGHININTSSSGIILESFNERNNQQNTKNNPKSIYSVPNGNHKGPKWKIPNLSNLSRHNSYPKKHNKKQNSKRELRDQNKLQQSERFNQLYDDKYDSSYIESERDDFYNSEIFEKNFNTNFNSENVLDSCEIYADAEINTIKIKAKAMNKIKNTNNFENFENNRHTQATDNKSKCSIDSFVLDQTEEDFAAEKNAVLRDQTENNLKNQYSKHIFYENVGFPEKPLVNHLETIYSRENKYIGFKINV